MPRRKAVALQSLRGVHVFVVDDEPPSLELVSAPQPYHVRELCDTILSVVDSR